MNRDGDNRMNFRQKMNLILDDFQDLNLSSQPARDALIDRVINAVRSESIDPKYWQFSTLKRNTDIIKVCKSTN
jgi:hypothetical protein